MIKQSVTYGDAETRGRLRQWKKKLAQNYDILENACERLSPNGKPAPLIVDMVKCSRSGRKAAFEKINKALGPGVTLESVSLGKNNRSLAIWSTLKPRDAVTRTLSDDFSERERASLSQNCVTVNYIVIGCIAGAIQLAEGLWTIEVPDHALGRAVERSRLLHPGVLIREAHLNLLDLPATVLERADFTDDESCGAYIKAGSGCFAGHFRIARDVSDNNQYCTSVRVKTWLDKDLLTERQIVLSEKAEAGKRLGDGWLLPHPLHNIERVGPNEMQVRAWSHGQ
jgi:hypothetical protein